jgi:hypothetical protein
MEQLAEIAAAKLNKDAPFVSVRVGSNYFNGTREFVTVACVRGQQNIS